MPELPSPDGLSDEDYLTSLIGDAERAAGRAAQSAQRPMDIERTYPVLDWSALWAGAGATVDWLCEPLLIAGRSVALFSPPKAGKTLLSLELTSALATGRPVLGNPARQPMRVLYVDLENTEDDLRERLIDLGYGPSDDLDNLRYLSFPDLPALDSPRGGEHLRAIAEHHAARLVVLDTVSRVIDGEENSADTSGTSTATRSCRSRLQAARCCGWTTLGAISPAASEAAAPRSTTLTRCGS